MTPFLPQIAMVGGLFGVLTMGVCRPSARTLDAQSTRPARALAVLAMLAGLTALLFVPGLPCELLRPQRGLAWDVLFVLGSLPLLFTMRASGELAPALILGSVLGMTVLASARNLLLLFLGLEVMSLPLYSLLYRLRPDRSGLEAALKYFFSGSLAGALFLYGLSVYYAAAGGLDLALAGGAGSGALRLAVILMGCAALFKVGAFPLHFWLPDAYEAAPAELSAFMSTSVKAAGFILLLRLAQIPVQGGLLDLLPCVSVLTMTAGNLLALRQKDLQRLLAYSSIAHVGYMLAGLWAGVTTGRSSGLYCYLAVYVAMSSAAFLFVRASGIREVSGLRGLWRRDRARAAGWALSLLALAGVPPTGGFTVKLFVVLDLIRAGSPWLAVALAVNSVVGLGYYFQLLRLSFLEPGPEAPPEPAPASPADALLWAGALLSLTLGLWPSARGLIEGAL